MKNILLLFLLFIVSQTAFGGGIVPKGTIGETLPAINRLTFGPSQLGGLLEGVVDPTSVATNANIGSIYQDIITGKQYKKLDDGLSTNWLELADSIQLRDTLFASQSSGIISGCDITINVDNISVDIAACKVRVVDNYTDALNPDVTYLDLPPQNVSIPNLATQDITVFTVDKTGTIFNTTDLIPTSEQMRDNVLLGAAFHPSRVIVDAVNNETYGSPIDVALSLADWRQVFGTANYEGNVFTENATTPLQLDKTVGRVFGFGINYKVDGKSQNFKDVPSCTVCTWNYNYRDGAGGWISMVGSDTLTPGLYDDGTGTLAVVPNNRFTITRVYLAGQTLVFQYGQELYLTVESAKSDAGFENIETNPELEGTTILGWIILRGNDVTVPQDQILTARPNTIGAGGSNVEFNVLEAQLVTPAGNPNLITECNKLVLADATTGPVTVTLEDSAAANQDCVNRVYLLNGPNSVTVTTQGGTQTIGGQTTQVINTEDTGFTVFSYPTTPEWLIIQDNRNSQIAVLTNETTFVDGIVTAWNATDRFIKSTTMSIVNGIMTGVRMLAEGIDFYNIGVQTGDEAVGTGATCVDTDKTTVCTATAGGDYFEFPLVTLDSDENVLGALFDYESTAEVTCEVRDSSDNVIGDLILASSAGEKLNAKIPFFNFTGQKKLRCTFAASGTYTIEKLAWTDSPFVAVTLTQDGQSTQFYGSVNEGSANQRIAYFPSANDLVSGNCYEYTSDSTSGTIITMINDCMITVSLDANDVGSSLSFGVGKNLTGTDLTTGAIPSLDQEKILATGAGVSGTANGYTASVRTLGRRGDKFYPRLGSAIVTPSDRNNLNVSATPTGTTKGFANSAELPLNEFSATIDVDGLGGAVITNPNADWLVSCSGGGVNAADTSCTYPSTFATAALNCTAKVVEDNTDRGEVVKVSSSTGFTVNTFISSTGTPSPRDFTIKCQRGADYKKVPTTIVAPVAVKDEGLEFLTQADVNSLDGSGQIKFDNVEIQGDAISVDNSGAFTKFVIDKIPSAGTISLNMQTGGTIMNSTVRLYSSSDVLLDSSIAASGNSGDWAFASMAANHRLAEIGGYFVFRTNTTPTNLSAKVSAFSLEDSGFIALDKTQVYKYAHNKTSSEKAVGEWFGCPLYEKSYNEVTDGFTDTALKITEITPRNEWAVDPGSVAWKQFWFVSGTDRARLSIDTVDLAVEIETRNNVNFTVQYTKNSECP